MLIYIDKERAVRVYRQASPTARREPVATINKSTFQVSADKEITLENDEKEAIQGVIAIYTEAQAAQSRAHALNFPKISREVMDYFQASASPAEQDLIFVALREAYAVARQKIADR